MATATYGELTRATASYGELTRVAATYGELTRATATYGEFTSYRFWAPLVAAGGGSGFRYFAYQAR